MEEILEYQQTPKASTLDSLSHLPREELDAIFDLLKALQKKKINVQNSEDSSKLLSS